MWQKVTAFHFPGTDSGASPNRFRALGRNTKSGSSRGGKVRIYDATNGNEVAVVSIFNTKVTVMAEDVSLQNLPTSASVFEVQARAFGNGNKFRLESIEIRRE